MGVLKLGDVFYSCVDITFWVILSSWLPFDCNLLERRRDARAGKICLKVLNSWGRCGPPLRKRS